ncbi:MAG: hypothetical protein R2757_19220 [Draconibacterium sp.]
MLTEEERLKKENRELSLREEELELRIDRIKHPWRNHTFWTSIIAALVALIGIAGQSYLSSIKSERAELRLDEAKVEEKKARKSLENAKDSMEIAREKTKIANDSFLILKKNEDVLIKRVNELNKSIAYTKSELNTLNSEKDEVSKLLLQNSMQTLLENSTLKVYYVENTKAKAMKIDSLFKSNGVNSRYQRPGYSISKNEIVYYNAPQKDYCYAIQKLLRNNGYNDFTIRPSSGPSSTIEHFKVYVAKN